MCALVTGVQTCALPISAIVSSIEVLKAGASSIYGSDAVAGVVNIITDNKLRGLHIEGQINVPEVGAGVVKRVAASFGFASDRLTTMGSVEYRNRNKLSRNDVPRLDCAIGGYQTGAGTELGRGERIRSGGTPCFPLAKSRET